MISNMVRIETIERLFDALRANDKDYYESREADRIYSIVHILGESVYYVENNTLPVETEKAILRDAFKKCIFNLEGNFQRSSYPYTQLYRAAITLVKEVRKTAY